MMNERNLKKRISDSIPYLKLEDDIRDILQSGMGDFYLILNYMEIASTFQPSRSEVIVRRVAESWNAPIGFSLKASDLFTLIQAIKFTAKENASYPVIYFDCYWPGRKTNHVERERNSIRGEQTIFKRRRDLDV